MSVFEANTIVFHGTTNESRKKIRRFLQDYNALFKNHFGEDDKDGNIYIGGIPTYGFMLENTESDSFPANKGYYVVGLPPRWDQGWYWENSIAFLSIFMEQKLCTKITWYQYKDQGIENIIYISNSQKNARGSWKHFKFVPGENGAPPECDEDGEDNEAFNQFVAEIMKGEREVDWKDGFPNDWKDECERLLKRLNREDNDFDDDV